MIAATICALFLTVLHNILDSETCARVSCPVFSSHSFHFHPAILKPDLNLTVGEVYAPANLQAALASQVHVEEEFFFQL